jgi:predicted  nucleic acid-binding Zn-ribbon protein
MFFKSKLIDGLRRRYRLLEKELEGANKRIDALKSENTELLLRQRSDAGCIAQLTREKEAWRKAAQNLESKPAEAKVSPTGVTFNFIWPKD